MAIELRARAGGRAVVERPLLSSVLRANLALGLRRLRLKMLHAPAQHAVQADPGVFLQRESQPQRGSGVLVGLRSLGDSAAHFDELVGDASVDF
jgi:hypothetical protein